MSTVVIAASYALSRSRRYAAGFTAALLIGVGHLISSIAVGLVFFGAKTWFELGALDWMKLVAGALLIALGLWALRALVGLGGGQSHTHGGHHHHDNPHEHGEHGKAGAPAPSSSRWASGSWPA